jgi:RNA polymerase sigma factor (sigma-70 family)
LNIIKHQIAGVIASFQHVPALKLRKNAARCFQRQKVSTGVSFMHTQFAALSRDQRLAIAFRCCVQLLDRNRSNLLSEATPPVEAKARPAFKLDVVAPGVAVTVRVSNLDVAPQIDEDEDVQHEQNVGSALVAYMSSIKQIAHLETDEEIALFKRFHQGDETARDALIQANLWLVPVVVRKFAGNGITLEDLIEEGNLALFSALERFDPTKEVRFSTYAKWWILKAATQARRSMAYPLRVPRLANKPSASESGVDQKNEAMDSDRDGEVIDISKATGRAESTAVSTKHPSTPRIDSISLDDATTHLDQKAMEMLGGQFCSETEQAVVVQQALDTLFIALDTLPERERMVIEHRYALNDKPEMTLQELGDMLGVTAERVRKIQLSAMEKLKQCVFPSR